MNALARSLQSATWVESTQTVRFHSSGAAVSKARCYESADAITKSSFCIRHVEGLAVGPVITKGHVPAEVTAVRGVAAVRSVAAVRGIAAV